MMFGSRSTPCVRHLASAASCFPVASRDAIVDGATARASACRFQGPVAGRKAGLLVRLANRTELGRRVVGILENKRVIGIYEFEEDAKKVAAFQNKNQVWSVNGGIPKFFYNK